MFRRYVFSLLRELKDRSALQLVAGIRERSSITSAHWRGVGGLTENADAADASRGGGGSQVKIDDVILEHIC